MSQADGFVPLKFEHRAAADLEKRSADFFSMMKTRRTVRDFSTRDVPESVIANALATAGTAPSGANMQPWHFVAVRDTETKKQIRLAAEAEEKELYDHRASEEWLEALAPLGTNADKPFLETAPWLITVFSQKYSVSADGRKTKHYYTPESVGIATGFLIAALHQAGLATLTHTPSPMGVLRNVLDRPNHEKPFLLLVVGYPQDNAQVPNISRKPFTELFSIK